MLRQEKTVIFLIVGVIQLSVTHLKFACAAHQAVTMKAVVCCVRVCNFSILACIVLTVASIFKIL
jgi:hypothetical protein